MNISVAMATYNGERYISAQIDSILMQLSEQDELIISDDHSKDRTPEIIQSYIERDARVKLFPNHNQSGVLGNFENAIRQCTNELIFLCDQDDVWATNKVAVVKSHFIKDPDLLVVLSDLMVVDENLEVISNSLFNDLHSKKGIVRNLVKNCYIGCAMTFRADFRSKVLPFPNVPMHDMWIGILAECTGKVALIDDKLIYYRRHSENVTPLQSKSSVPAMIRWRVQMITALTKRIVFKK